jgi:hypothetical protein
MINVEQVTSVDHPLTQAVPTRRASPSPNHQYVNKAELDYSKITKNINLRIWENFLDP